MLKTIGSTSLFAALLALFPFANAADVRVVSSGGYLLNVFAQLGIAEVMQPKITSRNAIEGGINLVRDGEIETGLYLATEILPAALQGYIVYVAAVAPGLGAGGAATQFVKFLPEPAMLERWRNAGFDTPGSH